ncbi:ATP-binding protein [Kutzneria buriramensis]|uniref:AAA ATPase-like protein n=1 Tax=Kutzneria buriramensis TaxID=1045776 RepID=A0A3E0I674_9PSEU|nr:ATP-binding protein [Kutzneria buriramensis]REH54026.1 AAA ATPase-like protein [Kutzneria buriramensis]
MVDITGLRNPYDYANPVRTVEYFAGRGSQLATIDYVLKQAGTTRPVGYLALYGRRAAGKTSLLNMTEKLAAERGYLVARANLVPANADPASFFATVYEELIGAVAGVCELTSPDGRKITPRVVRRIIEGGPVDGDFPLEFPENLAHAITGGQLSEMALRNDLRHLMELVGRPIVLLVDEAQMIADRPDVLSLLRTLGMRLEGYVLVLAGTPELVARINEVFDFLLRQFEFVRVERFSEAADVVQCMARPLEAVGLDPSRCFGRPVEDVASDLMPLTDGNPYEIQLFCHVMFARWQTDGAATMVLTAQAVDDVRATLDVGNEHVDRPLVKAVRQMSDEALLALNIWCSALEQATVDEIRFASRVSGAIALDADQLDRHLDGFVRDGLIELVNNTVRLIGDAAEHIWVRLSTVQRLGPRASILLSSVNFRYLLASQLWRLLDHHVLGGDRWLLRTCCLAMRSELLDQGVLDLRELPADREISYTVEYLHEAILESAMPQALHLTSVECSYGETTATRWICRGAADDFDLDADPAFRAAQERIAGLGGVLRAERSTIPLKPMAEIVEWLVERFDYPEKRPHMAHRHVSAALDAYEVGDIVATFSHLDTAFRLFPYWGPANNLAYLNLVAGDYSAARDWVRRAVPLSKAADQRALSRYNGGVAAALEGDWDGARALLADAAADLEHRSPLEEDTGVTHLMIPAFEDRVVVHEVRDPDLADAIARARDVVELAERFERLRGSA